VPHADSATDTAAAAAAAAGATDDKNNTGSDRHADRYKAAIRAELDPSQLSPISRRRLIDRERKRLVTSIVDVTKIVAFLLVDVTKTVATQIIIASVTL
jgi:hypothetical protein